MAGEVINRQRRHPVDMARWREFTAKALKAVRPREEKGATIVFVSDRAIRDLNRRYRGKDYATDVLSFRSEPKSFERREMNLGDVVISIERAAAQANEHGLTLEEEIAQLILHGLLHLCGYDHATDQGEMNAEELRLRRHLGV